MAKPKRLNSTMREKSLQQVAELYLAGHTQHEIGQKLGLSQSMISRDLKVLRERWKASGLIAFDEAKALELAKLDNTERQAWKSFLESRGEMEETTTEDITLDGGDGVALPGKKMRLKKWREAGDPRYLQTILDSIEKRCKILGLFAADKMEHSGSVQGNITVISSVPRPERTNMDAILEPIEKD